MSPTTIFFILLSLSVIGYYLGRRRAYAVASDVSGIQNLHSRPTYYGALVALWCGIPALLLFGIWLAFEDSVIFTGKTVVDQMAGADLDPADFLDEFGC